MTPAVITRLFSAVKSEKNGKVYLSALATTQGTKSVLGTSTEVQCLVNIELAELSDGIKALMTDMGNDRYKGDKDNDLAEPIAVNFLSMQPNVAEDGTERFWCKVG